MTRKRQILKCLTKQYLYEIAKDHEISGAYRMNAGDLVSALSRKPSVKIEEILKDLPLQDLKIVCQGVGLDEKGRTKALLVDRLLGRDTRKMPKPVKKHNPQPGSKLKTPSKHSIAVGKKRITEMEQSNNANPELVKQTKTSFDKSNNFQGKANFIWQVADDILRGTFKPHEYGDVILPFVVLRRLDCVFEPHKDKVIKNFKQFKDKLDDPAPVLFQAAGGLTFYNTSYYDLKRLAQDAGNIELNFNNYVNSYSENVREIIENFQIEKIVTKLVKNDLLFMLVDKFTEVDLNPKLVSNHEMGYIFEELLRRFSEMSNETAGEHYTPREVINLMVSLMFAEHQDELNGKGIIRTVYDPACGTGGMLTLAKEYINQHINPDADIVMYGQELNEQTYAIAKSDVLIVGEEADNIQLGTSFSNDRFKGNKFNYMLSNPPFGVSWKKEKAFIENEANDPHGRFHAGLPRISDGAMMFLQHMISKMEPSGSRIAIIHNGSPLFTGDAGSGESNIRKWIIENDMLKAIVALPTELFYNTGIATYIWLVTNRKSKKRRGKVQLINAVGFFEKMRKNLGNKRNYITDDQIKQITELYTSFEDGEFCMISDNEDFGYTKVIVERPLVENGKIKKDSKGNPKTDTKLRDSEKVPLKQDVDEYFEQEVLPHVPDAWMDRGKDKIGYEINFTKYFYKYQPLRPLEEIKADILALEQETEGLLKEILI